jgi:beta-aspartyl-peptidase (threonine type)
MVDEAGREPIVVASRNGDVGIGLAIDLLRAGGSALDAVVTGIKAVEANPNDHSVGFSGLPNLLGQVELDASIMDGRGLQAGAVGAMRRHQDAIETARIVMERLPHVLIAGDGADRLAAESGLPEVDLLTPEAQEIWRSRFENETQDVEYMARVRELVGAMAMDPEHAEERYGTVNFIARDARGDLACGVSTSGFAWKYPGRLGDSPIVGAGNYADNRWGAAACTGRGEMAQRCLTAHSVVTFLRFGMGLDEALSTAMRDLRDLEGPYASEMNIVALDRHGRHGGASTTRGKTYIYMTTEMSTYDEAERLHVPLR